MSKDVVSTKKNVLEGISVYSVSASLRELVGRLGYDLNHMTSANHREIGEKLAEFVGAKEPWSRSYVANILADRGAGKEITHAIEAMLAHACGLPEELAKSHEVTIRVFGEVPAGSLCYLKAKRCANLLCNYSFIGYPNQKYHNPACGAAWRKMKNAKGGSECS